MSGKIGSRWWRNTCGDIEIMVGIMMRLLGKYKDFYCSRLLPRVEGHRSRNSRELSDVELEFRLASLEVAVTGYRRR